MKTILITGCSTGIGHAACEIFAERGWTVLAASRDPSKLHFNHPAIQPSALDVNNEKSIARYFDDLRKKNVVLDCVVNNAGYGVLLPFEDTPLEEIKKMFSVNVFGLMEMSRHAATMMRERGAGTIINISSVLGLVGLPWYAAYAASKFAVEGFSEALGHELKPFNVHVKLIEPSGTKTEFHHVAYDTFGVKVRDAYRDNYERKRARHEKSSAKYASAETIAEFIWDAANDSSWRIRYSAPEAKFAMLGQRLFGRDCAWKYVEKKFGGK